MRKEIVAALGLVIGVGLVLGATKVSEFKEVTSLRPNDYLLVAQPDLGTNAKIAAGNLPFGGGAMAAPLTLTNVDYPTGNGEDTSTAGIALVTLTNVNPADLGQGVNVVFGQGSAGAGYFFPNATVNAQIFRAVSFQGALVGNGTWVTNLNADKLASGTVNQSRLPSWLALPTNSFFLFDGDSHTIRLLNFSPITNYPAFLNFAKYCPCTVRDLREIMDGYSTNIAPRIPSAGQVGVYVFWVGDHDYQSSYGQNPHTVVSNMSYHLTRVHNAGFRIAQMTATAVSNAMDAVSCSNLMVINTWIRTNDVVDYKVDVDARFPNPLFEREDGIHLTEEAYTNVAQMLDYALRTGPNKTPVLPPAWENNGTNWWLWDHYHGKPLVNVSTNGEIQARSLRATNLFGVSTISRSESYTDALTLSNRLHLQLGGGILQFLETGVNFLGLSSPRYYCADGFSFAYYDGSAVVNALSFNSSGLVMVNALRSTNNITAGGTVTATNGFYRMDVTSASALSNLILTITSSTNVWCGVYKGFPRMIATNSNAGYQEFTNGAWVAFTP